MSRVLSDLAATRTLLVTDEEMAIGSRKCFHQIVVEGRFDRLRKSILHDSRHLQIRSLYEHCIGCFEVRFYYMRCNVLTFFNFSFIAKKYSMNFTS